MNYFPHITQQDQKDCGPTCLKIVAKHYKKIIPIQKLRDLCETTREGSSMMGLSDAAEAIGFRTIGVKMTFEVLQKETPLPCVLKKGLEDYKSQIRSTVAEGKAKTKEYRNKIQELITLLENYITRWKTNLPFEPLFLATLTIQEE
jgi:ABC-type bacteriocin/lantibiotic exporter with double-glycine peptidase domain